MTIVVDEFVMKLTKIRENIKSGVFRFSFENKGSGFVRYYLDVHTEDTDLAKGLRSGKIEICLKIGESKN